MGRKSIGSEGEESKVISFRVSADTHDKLLKKIQATGLTKSEFIRDYVLQEKTTVVQAADQDAQQQHKKILFTVATASNNLNQIARVLNTLRVTDSLDLDAFRVAMTTLNRIDTDLKRFANLKKGGTDAD